MSATLTTDGMTKTEKAERAAALMRRANLAAREGNWVLAKGLREKAEALVPTIPSQLIKLPDAETLDEAYAALGFLPHPQGDGWIDVRGIYRRLNAAVTSIRSRGFSARDIKMGVQGSDGFRSFLWESDGGCWTPRHWRVTGNVARRGDKVVATNVVVAVKSSASAEEGRVEWTAFRGRALNRLIGRRLTEILSVIGARALVYGENPLASPNDVTIDSLTDEERRSYHDLHPSPAAAFVAFGSRVVLWDDNSGSGSLEGTASKKPFIKVALDVKPESFDGDIPLSDR